MKKILLTLGFFLPAALSVQAGETGIPWAQPNATVFATAPLIGALQFKTFSAPLVQIYAAMPRTGTPFQLQLPLPDGSFRTFEVRYTPISSEELYQRNPGLEAFTFSGVQVGNPGVTAKLDVTPAGFHAMIMEGGNQYFIDPYNRASTGTYIVYDKRHLNAEGRQRMVCEVSGESAITTPTPGPAAYVSGVLQRDYRVALSCTGEYAQAATGLAAPTKLQVLAQMATTLNRVNGVYERELAMHLTLVPNTDELIFLDGNTDPFTNNVANALINENQNLTDATIGPLNYDLGHVFSTGGGGLASLGVLCSPNKAKGVTGAPNPIGDPFDIDYVAHEMGHQLNAEHTFNAATGSCSGNGVVSQAFEPGSGSTIMAYAGICGSVDNLQPNSSAYFHTSSLRVITSFLATRTCGLSMPSGNIPPTVPPVAASYSIPYLTPFELTAPQATPGNSSGSVTYCWEQYDLGSFRASFPNTISSGPIFRSFPPADSTTRVFPTPSQLVRNTFYYLGEKLPTVSRTLKFRLTVREVRNGLGTLNIPDGGDVNLNVIKTTDTFQITSFPDATVPLRGGQPTQLEWNVATTDAAPINCSTVDIYYSLDSGYTFPYLLKKSTPNDGSETITVPNVTTTKGRFKLKASENVFFCLNTFPLTVFEEPVSIAGGVVYERELKLFPVPTTDAINIQNALKSGEAQLFNLLGQPVWKGTIPTGTSTISVKDLPRGSYYFRFQQTGDTQVATRALLLQ